MAQQLPLPLTVSCFSKIQIGFTLLVLVSQVVPDKGPLNGCVCVCVFSERECGGNWYKFLYRQNALLFLQIAVLKNFLKVTWSTDLNQGKSATVGHVLFASGSATHEAQQ